MQIKLFSYTGFLSRRFFFVEGFYRKSGLVPGFISWGLFEGVFYPRGFCRYFIVRSIDASS